MGNLLAIDANADGSDGDTAFTYIGARTSPERGGNCACTKPSRGRGSPSEMSTVTALAISTSRSRRRPGLYSMRATSSSSAHCGAASQKGPEAERFRPFFVGQWRSKPGASRRVEGFNVRQAPGNPPEGQRGRKPAAFASAGRGHRPDFSAELCRLVREHVGQGTAALAGFRSHGAAAARSSSTARR